LFYGLDAASPFFKRTVKNLIHGMSDDRNVGNQAIWIPCEKKISGADVRTVDSKNFPASLSEELIRHISDPIKLLRKGDL
jgi:hypothetical protein